MRVTALMMERVRLTLCGLSIIGTIAHIMGLVGYFEYKFNMFGITLVHYPHAKAILEGLGIFASVILGVGALLKQRAVVFGYVVFGVIYIMAHLVCSTVMMKFMLRFFGFGLAQMKAFICTTIGTFVLLIGNVGLASFYVIVDVEKKREDKDEGKFDENPVPGPSTSNDVRLNNFIVAEVSTQEIMV